MRKQNVNAPAPAIFVERVLIPRQFGWSWDWAEHMPAHEKELFFALLAAEATAS